MTKVTVFGKEMVVPKVFDAVVDDMIATMKESKEKDYSVVVESDNRKSLIHKLERKVVHTIIK